MTIDEFLATLTASGVTVEALALILTRSAVLVTIESKKAEIARKQEERQTAINAFDTQLQTLQGELNAMVAQGNLSL